MSGKATALSCANIAFVKYWGRRDESQRLPLNGSISMNLDRATTTTTVAFDLAQDQDVIAVAGENLTTTGAARVTAHLDRIRNLAGFTARARVVSENSFPMGAGIASSASAFAALTVAGAAAAGLALDERALSILARLGSGSACRSIPAGFVEWYAADSSDASFAEQIAPPDHWDLCDLITIVERGHKRVGSTEGQSAVATSPFAAARLAAAERALPRVRQALRERDFDTFGAEAELEALRMHAVAMTAQPSVLYWAPETVVVIRAVREWRDTGIPAYFTIDAGANIHVLCLSVHAAALEQRLHALRGVLDVLVNRPGPATHLIGTHLF